LAVELEKYWLKWMPEAEVKVSVKRGLQILHRFYILDQLGIAGPNDSPALYVKSDISPMTSKIYGTEASLQSRHGFSYLVTHYDLSTLMTSKIHAVLYRERFEGRENREIVKGRDFFDLLWFLDKKVEPNMERFGDLLGRKASNKEMWEMVTERVKWALSLSASFERDLYPFIDNQAVIKGYIENYLISYNEKKKYLNKN